MFILEIYKMQRYQKYKGINIIDIYFQITHNYKRI
ncbi:hypothetical protein QGC_1959, partial [Clostridioides difficile CD196]